VDSHLYSLQRGCGFFHTPSSLFSSSRVSHSIFHQVRGTKILCHYEAFLSVVHLFKRSVVSPALAAFCVDSVLSADLMAILVACLVCITLSVYTVVQNACTHLFVTTRAFFQHVSRKSNLHRLKRPLKIICGFSMAYLVWSPRVPHYMFTLPLKFLTCLPRLCYKILGDLLTFLRAFLAKFYWENRSNIRDGPSVVNVRCFRNYF